MLPYDVLEQLARDRCQQRQAQAQAERLVLAARVPPRRRPLQPALVLLARARRQAARA
jgi:hypothetical protein